ncbi:MAG: hypothetical protein CVV41_22095 [Candidatus Riflebacteria bacterium HGW-Riflebacteria-1]|jgi:ABC-type uncharacterized transport system substrate-binding protein|nr:MAG: hypothetical protein CVV41_22095 [Candidatus Riflebacteria bacterium HGW-Riflebacteria-1]
MQSVRRQEILIGVLAILLWCLPSLAGAEVWVFFRPDIPLHIDTVKGLQSLTNHRLVFCPVGKTSFSFLESKPPDFAIAFGDTALQLAMQMAWNINIVSTLIDSPPDDSRIIFLDTRQPYAQQIQLLKSLAPGIKNIWYPYATPRFAPDDEIDKAIKAAGLQIDSHRLSNPRALPLALREFGQPDTAALLPPDPGLMNNAFIQAILLTSFRAHAPVVSFSESLVKQGAAFAYVITPESLAESINDIMTETIKNRPTKQMIRQFDRWQLILNVTVLDKLHIQIPERVKKSATRLY